MGDRLSEIKERWMSRPCPLSSTSELGRVYSDIAWLVAENERLTAELAYLRDHPGWVPPQTGSEK